MEQKRPVDIFHEALDYLWNGLGLEEKGWKRLKKGDFKKRMKNGLTYHIWFDRSRYNYIDYEIGHGNVEVGFICIIKQGDDWLYSFKIEPTTGGSFFRMLTEDCGWTPGCWTPFYPWSKPTTLTTLSTALRWTCQGRFSRSVHPLLSQRITAAHSCGGADGGEIRNTGAAGGIPASGGTAQDAGKQGTPVAGNADLLFLPCRSCEPRLGCKSHRRRIGCHCRGFYDGKKTISWNEEDEAGYQLYLQEQDIEKRTYRTWYLIANPRNLPKEFVQQELEFRFKLFHKRKKEKK